jgi:hypothetical protein
MCQNCFLSGNDDIAMIRPLPLSLQTRALMALHGHLFDAVPFLRVRIHDLRFWKILLRGLEQVLDIYIYI